ncbi:MAG: hypothetical protein EZS28_029700 [Streblomastix strix]|uniref:non-specific serine/threonine protein kinase n=1 Tax=Streblomastix strix TaxID=222440 RepID=A0A5J4UXF7_9EUKA|nr:MAG: hypothetical protein EZS28_029700 [Streblomastix strix]
MTLPYPTIGSIKSESFFKSVIITNQLLKQRDEEQGIRTINQYIVHEKIGEGAFAKVKLVHIINDPNKVYAMKVIKKETKKRAPMPQSRMPRGIVTQKQEDIINKEVAVMKKMKHPNIVRLREVIDDSSRKKLQMSVFICI